MILALLVAVLGWQQGPKIDFRVEFQKKLPDASLGVRAVGGEGFILESAGKLGCTFFDFRTHRFSKGLLPSKPYWCTLGTNRIVGLAGPNIRIVTLPNFRTRDIALRPPLRYEMDVDRELFPHGLVAADSVLWVGYGDELIAHSLSNGAKLASMRSPFPGLGRPLALSRSGKHLITQVVLDGESAVAVFEVRGTELEPLKTLRLAHPIRSVSFLGDSRVVLTMSEGLADAGMHATAWTEVRDLSGKLLSSWQIRDHALALVQDKFVVAAADREIVVRNLNGTEVWRTKVSGGKTYRLAGSETKPIFALTQDDGHFTVFALRPK